MVNKKVKTDEINYACCPIILYTSHFVEDLVQSIAQDTGWEVMRADAVVFPTAEMEISLKGKIDGRKVILLETIEPPSNFSLFRLMLLAHTAQKAGSACIIAVVPYIGYSRQCSSPNSVKKDFAVSDATTLIPLLLQQSGINRLITVDLHSQLWNKGYVRYAGRGDVFADKGKKSHFGNKVENRIDRSNDYEFGCDIGVGVESYHHGIKSSSLGNSGVLIEIISPAIVVSKILAKIDIDFMPDVLVSPDNGSINRVKEVAELLGLDFAIIEKKRNNQQYGVDSMLNICQMKLARGKVKDKNCLIIDDMIDTGSTIIAATDLLIMNGAKSVSAYVTHGIFSLNALERVKSSNLSKLYVTDSLPLKEISDGIEVFSLSSVIVEYLRKTFK